nr:phage tape measure protein [uncultured Mediterranean phage uvMED]BAR21506.1 phage tape measure protein [uncultured Mediterranean phage uvMED]BAR21539.1 phage tape measure protein [uncultured Mediterranean phage uvMED]BAR38774.1 phage tape measure protein [uncultured Mediterranean phage uvMED]
MAGSNYDVNIKLNVRDINRQLNNLERRISKLNAIAQGKKGDSKILLKNERDKTAQLLRQERTQKKINRELEKTNKLKRENLTLNNRAAAPSRPISRGRGTTVSTTGGGGGGALSGALISGAFPLLFGQGLVGGAAGFAGGLIGGKLGGQTGGFAGGLVATAGLTLLTNLRDGVTDLGNALDPAVANIDQSIEKLKVINRTRAAEIKLIEQLEGKQAALAEITKDTAKVIGNDGVKALREFAQTMKLFADSMSGTFLKIQATLANIANRVFSFTGTDLSKAKANLGSDDPLITALERNLTAQSNLDRNVDPNDPLSGSFLMTPEGRKQGKTLKNEEKRLQMAIKVRSAKQSGARLDKEIGIDHRNLVKSIDAQFGLENRILELRKTGLNPALAKQIVLIEKSSENIKIGLQNELDSVNKLIEAEKASGKGYTDKLMFLELTKLSLEDQLKTNEELNKTEKERIINASRLARAAKATQDSFDALKQTIATDIADGIQGLIRGATTLNQVMNNVLNKLIDAAFNLAFFGNAGGSLIPGSGLFGGLFRADGGPVKGGNSYVVGERGPEMFTPGVSGTITPNHALGGGTNVVVNVDASGSNVEGDEDRGRELGRLISVAVQSELVQQKRPGGLLA